MAKTVKIETIKTRANFFFAHTDDTRRNERRALQTFVESFLHDANAYKGFRYLTREEMKPGFSIGVNHGPNGPEFPDDSRISFY